MSTARPRPVPPRPASKRPEDRPQDKGERSTGVRVKTPEPIIEDAAPAAPIPIAEAPAVPVPQAEGIRNNSIAPEALRKPFASLAPSPRKRADSDPDRTATPVARPPSAPQDMSWDENSNLTGSRSRPARAVCKKHKIAKGKDGECILCKREQQKQDSGLGWKAMVGLMVIALIGAAIAALNV